MDSQQQSTRRAFLVGSAAAAAAWMASLVGKNVPEVDAVSNVVLGGANKATTVTAISNTGTGSAISGVADGAGAAGISGSAGSSAAYGVFSSGRLGVTGPIELSPLTLSNYTVPAGKAILYVKTVSGVTELHVRFPSGVDRLITSG